jgi:hypothetical protein
MLSDLIRCNAHAAADPTPATTPATPPAVAPPKQAKRTERLVRGRFLVSEDGLSRQRRERDEVNALVARGADAAATLYTPVTPGGARGGIGGRQIALAGLDRAALSPADADRLREIAKGQRDGQRGSTGSRI